MAPELLGCCQDHRQSPLLAIIKSVPEVRALCSAGITRPHSSYGPVRRPRGPSPKVTLRARPSSPPGLPRLPVSLFQRAVPTTPADQDGCTCRLLPPPARPSPYLGGSASATSLSRPAQASLELRPVGSLNRPRRPLSQGFDPSGYPDKPPASYQIKPTTVWVVPSSTSDTRLLGARGVEERRGGLGPMGITPFPPRSSNRTCGFPASGFPTGLHTAVGQDGPDFVGSHRAPRTRPYRGNLVPRDDTLWRLTRK